VSYRYERAKRRLSASGEDTDRDIGSLRDLVQREIIRADLDAIIYTAPSEVLGIIRGRRLAALFIVLNALS
jgi:hypothetical protein